MSHLEPPTTQGSPSRRHSPSKGRQGQVGPVVTWRRVAGAVGGTVMTLLGLLWVVQGADLIRIRPILCVAECKPVTGGSVGWFALGVLTLLGGLWVLSRRLRPRS